MKGKQFLEIKNNGIQLVMLFIYTLLVCFFCSKMSPFYAIQEWSDVNLYFTIGKAVMNGQTLYADIFDHKGPLIFLIYGVGYLISNDTFFGVFLLEVVAWYITACSIYLISRLYLTRYYSLIASAIFLILYLSHTSEGGSAEEFITCLMSISLYLFIRFFKNPTHYNPRNTFTQGCLWASVLLIKFSLVVFWIFPLLALLIILLQQKAYKNLGLSILYFVLGASVLLVPTAFYFIVHGSLTEAIQTYFLLNSNADLGSFQDIVMRIVVSFYQRLKFETLDFIVILIGVFIFPFVYIKNNIARLSLVLTFGALFTMTFIAGYVHYYSIPYYLFAGLGSVTIFHLVHKYQPLEANFIVACLILFISTFLSIFQKDFFGKYASKPKENVVEAFLPIILEETEDRTLVNLALDDATALFTYANIIPNVKYFSAPNLPHDRFPTLRDEQTRYIEEGQTKFVVLAEHSNNAFYFSQLDALEKNYVVVSKFKEYYAWHNVDRYYYLYKRKDRK